MNENNFSLQNTIKKTWEQDIFFEDNLKNLLSDEILNNISKENLKLLLQTVSKQVEYYNKQLRTIRDLCAKYETLCQNQNEIISKMTVDLSVAHNNLDFLLNIMDIIMKETNGISEETNQDLIEALHDIRNFTTQIQKEDDLVE